MPLERTLPLLLLLLLLYAIATELYVVLLLLAPEPGAYVKFYVFGVVGFWFLLDVCIVGEEEGLLWSVAC